jgi:hypothetical protein
LCSISEQNFFLSSPNKKKTRKKQKPKKKLGKNKNPKKKKTRNPKTSQNFPKLPETSLPPKKTNSGKRIRESEFGKQRTKKKGKRGTENGVADTSGSDEESAGRKRKFYRD